MGNLTALARQRPFAIRICLLPFLLACGATTTLGRRAGTNPPPIQQETIRKLLYSLADDSMQGRRTGTEGARRAARYIARTMREIGLIPAGDSGYFQRVPLGMRVRAYGPPKLYGLATWTAYDSLPASNRITDANLIGILLGAAAGRWDSVIVVSAHYDHHGIDRPVSGDSILNGADDNASGVATVLEVARVMAHGPRLRRTVVFLFTTGEELGLLGVEWYVAHPVVPLNRTVAGLEIEMTGRPDSLAGGFGHAWLSGDERSTMGSLFRAQGLLVVADPRPSQRFFERSDNIAFARAGVPAHTLSTFNLHSDYHQVTDEPSRVDLAHMTAIAVLATKAVYALANGPAAIWIAGRRP